MHWARDANEANRIVTDLVRATGATEVVKVKSMVDPGDRAQRGARPAGIAACETDLAELIVQLGHDRPSHILVPAIHRNRAEIREIFLREMPGVDPDAHRRPAAGSRWPPARTCGASSSPPRSRVTGANFAVAETGTLARGRVRGQRPDVPDPAARR